MGLLLEAKPFLCTVVVFLLLGCALVFSLPLNFRDMDEIERQIQNNGNYYQQRPDYIIRPINRHPQVHQRFLPSSSPYNTFNNNYKKSYPHSLSDHGVNMQNPSYRDKLIMALHRAYLAHKPNEKGNNNNYNKPTEFIKNRPAPTPLTLANPDSHIIPINLSLNSIYKNNIVPTITIPTSTNSVLQTKKGEVDPCSENTFSISKKEKATQSPKQTTPNTLGSIISSESKIQKPLSYQTTPLYDSSTVDKETFAQTFGTTLQSKEKNSQNFNQENITMKTIENTFIVNQLPDLSKESKDNENYSKFTTTEKTKNMERKLNQNLNGSSFDYKKTILTQDTTSMIFVQEEIDYTTSATPVEEKTVEYKTTATPVEEKVKFKTTALPVEEMSVVEYKTTSSPVQEITVVDYTITATPVEEKTEVEYRTTALPVQEITEVESKTTALPVEEETVVDYTTATPVKQEIVVDYTTTATPVEEKTEVKYRTTALSVQEITEVDYTITATPVEEKTEVEYRTTALPVQEITEVESKTTALPVEEETVVDYTTATPVKQEIVVDYTTTATPVEEKTEVKYRTTALPVQEITEVDYTITATPVEEKTEVEYRTTALPVKQEIVVDYTTTATPVEEKTEVKYRTTALPVQEITEVDYTITATPVEEKTEVEYRTTALPVKQEIVVDYTTTATPVEEKTVVENKTTPTPVEEKTEVEYRTTALSVQEITEVESQTTALPVEQEIVVDYTTTATPVEEETVVEYRTTALSFQEITEVESQTTALPVEQEIVVDYTTTATPVEEETVVEYKTTATPVEEKTQVDYTTTALPVEEKNEVEYKTTASPVQEHVGSDFETTLITREPVTTIDYHITTIDFVQGKSEISFETKVQTQDATRINYETTTLVQEKSENDYKTTVLSLETTTATTINYPLKTESPLKERSEIDYDTTVISQESTTMNTYEITSVPPIHEQSSTTTIPSEEITTIYYTTEPEEDYYYTTVNYQTDPEETTFNYQTTTNRPLVSSFIYNKTTGIIHSSEPTTEINTQDFNMEANTFDPLNEKYVFSTLEFLSTINPFDEIKMNNTESNNTESKKVDEITSSTTTFVNDNETMSVENEHTTDALFIESTVDPSLIEDKVNEVKEIVEDFVNNENITKYLEEEKNSISQNGKTNTTDNNDDEENENDLKNSINNSIYGNGSRGDIPIYDSIFEDKSDDYDGIIFPSDDLFNSFKNISDITQKINNSSNLSKNSRELDVTIPSPRFNHNSSSTSIENVEKSEFPSNLFPENSLNSSQSDISEITTTNQYLLTDSNSYDSLNTESFLTTFSDENLIPELSTSSSVEFNETTIFLNTEKIFTDLSTTIVSDIREGITLYDLINESLNSMATTTESISESKISISPNSEERTTFNELSSKDENSTITTINDDKTINNLLTSTDFTTPTTTADINEDSMITDSSTNHKISEDIITTTIDTITDYSNIYEITLEGETTTFIFQSSEETTPNPIEGINGDLINSTDNGILYKNSSQSYSNLEETNFEEENINFPSIPENFFLEENDNEESGALTTEIVETNNATEEREWNDQALTDLIPILIDELRNNTLSNEEKVVFQEIYGEFWDLIVERSKENNDTETKATRRANRNTESIELFKKILKGEVKLPKKLAPRMKREVTTETIETTTTIDSEEVTTDENVMGDEEYYDYNDDEGELVMYDENGEIVKDFQEDELDSDSTESVDSLRELIERAEKNGDLIWDY